MEVIKFEVDDEEFLYYCKSLNTYLIYVYTFRILMYKYGYVYTTHTIFWSTLCEIYKFELLISARDYLLQYNIGVFQLEIVA